MSSSMGQVPAALQWLESQTSMPSEARQALAELAPRLLARMQPRGATSLAIGGPPGSGKSTLARMLAFLLTESGTPAIALSLDDYYLGCRDREDLARNQHALLRQRGVPGTHDWSRLLRDLDRLSSGRGKGLRLPVFDKSRDDPAPVRDWRRVDFDPHCVIVEGWCVGAPGQDPDRLREPVNELERLQDPEAIWRTLVNNRLACYRSDLVSRIGQFWYLEVPAWDRVIDWRWQQEQELDQARLRSREETGAFLATFERIVRHMQQTCASWADCRVRADSLHRWQLVE